MMKPTIMPTPNFGYKNSLGSAGGRGVKTRHNHRVKAIVLHVWEGLWTAGTRSWFFKVGAGVSYNDVVLKNGDWIQLVDPFDPAWANGGARGSTWPGLKRTSNGRLINPNLYTHAISREGYHREITPAQEKTLIYVAKFRAEQHGLPLVRASFIGHKDLSPISRPNCPGSGLNWERFIREIESETETVVEEPESIMTDALDGDLLSTDAPTCCVYTVQSGDTFLRVARLFKVEAAALVEVNPHIGSPARIWPGDKLNIPKGDNGGLHVVVSGDTLWHIAEKYKVDFPKLKGANAHIKDTNKIFPGDVIIIPKKLEVDFHDFHSYKK